MRKKNRFERFIFKVSELGQYKSEWHSHKIHNVMTIHIFYGYKTIGDIRTFSYFEKS